jgi:uncharacterized membrane protein YeaQ/YmgE (transglycosylase-associated protein family)
MSLETLTVVLVGLLAGGAAGFVLKAGPYGLIGDIVLGLTGSVMGSWLLRSLTTYSRVGLFPLIALTLVGAAGLLVAQRQVWHQPPAKPRRRRSVASGAWRMERE